MLVTLGLLSAHDLNITILPRPRARFAEPSPHKRFGDLVRAILYGISRPWTKPSKTNCTSISLWTIVTRIGK